ncbi:MAG: ATP synthase subunit I [Lachnospiraceae bacterium]|nr:ATP synthase subunit I [Lachnospiraceae bacterium]
MRIRNRKINPTMVSLIVLELIYGLIGIVIISGLHFVFGVAERIFGDKYIYIIIGFLIGILMSIILVMLMARTVENMLSIGDNGAVKEGVIGALIRAAIVIAVIVLLLVTHVGNVISMLIGLFGLKLSAYIQPIADKYIKKKIK